jgi:hypothetical protein
VIIDCHAHVFENWHGACGHPSVDIHLKYIQKNLTRPAARTFRLRDRKEVKPAMLFRADDNTWAGLTDLDFRVGPYGRLEFTHDGEEYAIQYMPVGMQRIESPPAFMIAQMTYAGVDHAILQAGGTYGAMNDYNAFAQNQHPERFTGLLHIDEAIADRDDVLAQVDRAYRRLGLKGLYYSHDFSRHGYERNLDHAAFAPLWDKVAAFALPVFVELSATPHYDRASYITNLMAFDRLMARYRMLRFVLVMGPPVAHFARGGRWDFPPEVLSAYRRENLLIEVMFPITWGGVWDYPYARGSGADRPHARAVRRSKACLGIRHAKCRALFAPIARAWIMCAAIARSSRLPRRTPCSAATWRSCSDSICDTVSLQL